MTNKLEIDRELLEQIHKELTSGAVSIETGAKVRALLAAYDLRDHCKQCADVVKDWPESKRDCLGKISAPVVEHQPVAWMFQDDDGEPQATCAWCVAKHVPGDVAPLYTSPPAPVAMALTEVRALLATANYSASRDCHNAQVVGAACDLIDKVKELNQ